MNDFEKVLALGLGSHIANTAGFVIDDLAAAGVMPSDGPQTSAQAAIVLLGVMGLPAPGDTVAVVDYWRHAMLSGASTIKTTGNFRVHESYWHDVETMEEMRQASPALFQPLLDLLTGAIECHRSAEQVDTIGDHKVLAFSLDHKTNRAQLDINLHASYEGGALVSRHEYTVSPDYQTLVDSDQWPPAQLQQFGASVSVAAAGSIFFDIADYLNNHAQAAAGLPVTKRIAAERRAH
ncbi:hypothetical protein [Pelagibius sp. Alg239-R121]|uniref:hypothetical protein n=1 Tax=Pelagibius sp. Alg239-R121 TaxID=2993448 RepID=UPI0024A6B093|nr:hypothetical protein [Pelagibius sp. Alg239-R121]